MLRSCRWLTKGLAHWTAPRDVSQAVVAASRTPLWNAAVWLSQSGKAKDLALPNSSWSQDMLNQFNKLMEMAEDRTWKKLPSYRDVVEHIPETMKEWHELKKDRGTRHFLRSIDVEGMGFEYAMFLNVSEKRMVSVFQLGPYLEGPPGFAHGGSIATILDATLGASAIYVAGRVMTANLSINYKSPTPLGSVVLVDCKLDRMEGRKMFITGEVRSIDGQTVHAEATALFIQLQSKK